MQMAGYTAYACSSMLRHLEAAEVGTPDRSKAIYLHMLAKETENLARMVFLFEPELEKRYVNAKELRRSMLSFPKRIEHIAGVKLGSDPDGRDVPPTQLANTPKNQWVYAGLDRLLSHGLLRGYRFAFPGQVKDDRHTRANESREVIAGAVIQSYSRVVATYRELHGQFSSDLGKIEEARGKLGQIRVAVNELDKSLELLLEYDDCIRDLILMTYEFSPEIKAAGGEPSQMISDLKAVLHGTTSRLPVS